ncbi:MAG: SPFH domain-containing protein [Pseudomonadota bacterium]|nr:SPFH domain-containing protein [Pseudomonadota bacterium]
MSYYQGVPDLYTIKFTDGINTKHGRGVSFWYLESYSSIIEIPAVAITQPFIFNEATSNFQDVTLQGNVTYRITAPLVASERFDFRRKSRLRAAGDGLEKLSILVVNLIQSHARNVVSAMELEKILTAIGTLSEQVTSTARTDGAFGGVGLTVESVHFTSARAQPEVQKALQTEYREKVQGQADRAIFARRSAAVQNERAIKEKELATEIELAEKRKQLVETEAVNTIRIAKAEAEAAQLKLSSYKGIAPSFLAGIALKDWAEKGGTVGNLTLTGDMIGDIARFMSEKNHASAK